MPVRGEDRRDETSIRDNWAGDLTSGIGAGLAYLPLIVVVAILSFGMLGTQTAVAMSIAVFGANIVAGVMRLLLARCPLLVGTPSGSSALVMAGLFGGLAAHGIVPDVADAMAITASVGVVVGVAQLILVRAGAAGLGPLAPYPVVSGLVNGTAALVLLSQVPTLRAHPFEIVVALATAVAMLWFPLRWRVPPVLPAVAVGIIVNALLRGLDIDTGPVLAAMPSPVAYPAMAADAASAWLAHATVLPWRDIVVAGVTIALLGVLETLATFSALTRPRGMLRRAERRAGRRRDRDPGGSGHRHAVVRYGRAHIYRAWSRARTCTSARISYRNPRPGGRRSFVPRR